MVSSRIRLVAIAIVLVVSNIAPAQEAKQRQELHKKTLTLVYDIASASWSLKLPENRLFVMTGAADLLWTFDEKRARALYWEALNSISLITQPPRGNSKNPAKAERQQVLQSYLSTFTLRRKIIQQVAQKDAQLALEMLRATRQVAPQQLGSEFRLPSDAQLEQDIAIEVAARDPAQALQFARESLAKGLTYELLHLLHRLNQKDSEKASTFAGEIIAKLRTTNVATDFRASTIAAQLLETSRIPDTNRPTLRAGEAQKVLSLNDEQKRDLVDVLLNAALSESASKNLLSYITDVMPEIQQFFPERRAALERKLLTFNEKLTQQERNNNTYNNLIRRGMPEDLVRFAVREGSEMRLHLYQQAAILAAIRGTTDSFRELVNKEVSDEGEQQKLLDFLDGEEIGMAAYRKKLDHLKSLFPKIRRKEERARAMAEAALLLKEQGEDAEASSLLDEAATLIKTDLKSETKTNALLSLLCAYAVIEPAKAFALAERTVDDANSQISLLMLLDRVVKSGAVKKSEIVLDQAGIMPLDFLVFRYGKGVAALAKTDFDRTRALADRFDRHELRVMARLMIVKGLLSDNQPQITNK